MNKGKKEERRKKGKNGTQPFFTFLQWMILSYPIIQIDFYIQQLPLGRVLIAHHGLCNKSSFKFFAIILILKPFVSGFGHQSVNIQCQLAMAIYLERIFIPFESSLFRKHGYFYQPYQIA